MTLVSADVIGNFAFLPYPYSRELVIALVTLLVNHENTQTVVFSN